MESLSKECKVQGCRKCGSETERVEEYSTLVNKSSMAEGRIEAQSVATLQDRSHTEERKPLRVNSERDHQCQKNMG